MKVILILAIVATFLDEIRGNSFLNLVSRRFKRNTKAIDFKDQACVVKKCLVDDLYPKLEKTINFNTLGGMINVNLTSEGKGIVKTKDFFSPELFDNVCGEFRNAAVCMEGCPESLLKVIVISTHEPFNFLCVEKYDEVKKHLDCYQKQFDKVDEQCRDKCKIGNVVQNEDPGERCKEGVCIMECLFPKMAKQCNNEAAKLFDELNKKSLEAIIEMLKNVMPDFKFPEPCGELGFPF